MARRCRNRSATSSPCATSSIKVTNPRPCAIFWPRCPTANPSISVLKDCTRPSNRLTGCGTFPAGESSALQARAQEARQKFEAALDDNLNTAGALGAIFDMVREGNTAMDGGEFHDADRGAFLDTLERWDRIFAVLENDDYAKLGKFGFR